MSKYRKKPVIIEARKLIFDKTIQIELEDWCGGISGPDGGIWIETLEGKHLASTGDFIIQGVKCEFYPCKPDIFEMTYEVVIEKTPSCQPDFHNDPPEGSMKYFTKHRGFGR